MSGPDNDNPGESGPTPQDGAQRLVTALYATTGDEIPCSEAARLIGLAADLLLDDAAAQERFPALFHHLQFCPDCTEEYQMVSDYARREAAGQALTPPHMPPLPREFQIATGTRARQILRALFGGFTPALPQGALRGAQTFWQAAVELGEGRQLRIETRVSSTDEDLRTLHFSLAGTAPAAPHLLRLETGGEVEQEMAFDAAGEAILRDVTPGGYQLRLLLADQEHLIGEFVIP